MIDSAVRILLRSADLLTRPPLLTLFALANACVAIALGAGYLAGVETPIAGSPPAVVVGDYLAFLTGADLLAGPDAARLYDLQAQKAAQARLAGIELDAWQPYVYPPLLAMLLAPLASLPFPIGLRLFGGLSLLAAILAGLTLARALPAVRTARLGTVTVMLLTVGFFPLASTLPGRQTTAITLALLCGALLALQSARPWLAGMVIGLLSYKPQFLLPLVLLIAWRGQWRVLAACAATCALHYVAGAWWVGADWPHSWFAASTQIAALEMAQNAARHFSVLPLTRALNDTALGPLFATLLIGAVVAAFVWRAPRAKPGDADFPLLWSMTIVAGMLASPYLQYYEFGLLVLPCAVALARLHAIGRPPGLALRGLFALGFLGYPMLVSGDAASRSLPLGLLLLTLFVWLCRVASAHGTPRVGRG